MIPKNEERSSYQAEVLKVGAVKDSSSKTEGGRSGGARISPVLKDRGERAELALEAGYPGRALKRSDNPF